LSLLSTIVGGGIVGLPFSMYHAGIPLGLNLNLLIAIASYYASELYLRAKELTPVPVESLYEIGFVALGSRSIYLISLLTGVSSFGLMMIYFIVFGDTAASLVRQINEDE